MGEPRFVPATPVGIMRLLQEYDVPLEGARAVVVGRSLIVGKPMSMLLLAANATVTTTHSRTADLGAHTREADVLVVAVGQVDVVTADMVKPGATVVDVGMNRTDEGLRGDVDPAAARGRRSAHSGSGRRGADDDRFAPPQHARSRPSAGAAKVSRVVALVRRLGARAVVRS